MAILLATSCPHCQDPLDKCVASRALRAETTLPPQHRWTQRPFGRIHPEGTRAVGMMWIGTVVSLVAHLAAFSAPARDYGRTR